MIVFGTSSPPVALPDKPSRVVGDRTTTKQVSLIIVKLQKSTNRFIFVLHAWEVLMKEIQLAAICFFATRCHYPWYIVKYHLLV